jgi:hypothetical protein
MTTSGGNTMETEYDIGQKVFYVCKEYSNSEIKVFEGFVAYIHIYSEANIEYGMTKKLDGEYHKTVPGYAIGLSESEAIRKHFTHNAKEHFKKANELLAIAESGKLKEVTK